jgi:hypothetical protein
VVAAYTVDWLRDTDGVLGSAADELAVHFLWCCSTGRPYNVIPSGESECDDSDGGMALSLLALEPETAIYTTGIDISKRHVVPTTIRKLDTLFPGHKHNNSNRHGRSES